MSELPTGTVSLLFSDIAGSTSLLARLGPTYVEVLEAHREMLRRAWATHGGTEMGTEGDSFFVVFPTAPEALAAAVQGQRELASYAWPGGEQVRVRMGIHAGSPSIHGGGYVGMDVHRAARIAGAAHGGQVVVSSAAAELVRAEVPDGVRLTDLGSYLLKDIPEPEHLFQVDAEGLVSDFAPLKAVGSASSLPVPMTPLVGRDRELAELIALVSSTDARLVTLTGPGGSGKTRLSIAVADSLSGTFDDGVHFLPLAAVTTAETMWMSIGEAFDVPREKRTPDQIASHLGHRCAVYVLDNLEQVPGADTVVAEILLKAPRCVVIATSRRRLNLPGEHEFPVPPLQLPDSSDSEIVGRSGAVQLFVQQAQSVRPGFRLTAANASEVAEVCRRLDGLPLALELVAVRSKLLSPAALLTRLDTALDLDTRGSHGPHRHRTLRATMEWSYDLLDPATRVVFRRLGVFSGGADLAAVSAVTGSTDPDEVLDRAAELLDSSLILVGEGPDGEPRIAMLQTVRAFAAEMLRTNGELESVRRAAASYFLDVFEKLTSDLAELGERRIAARQRFDLERDNAREALSWAFGDSDVGAAEPVDRRTALRLCAELVAPWWHGGHFAEARYWLERAADLDGGGDPLDIARCLVGLARIHRVQDDLDAARVRAALGVDLLRRLDEPEWLCRALLELGHCDEEIGDLPAARQAIEEATALSRTLDERPRILSESLTALVRVEAHADNFTPFSDLGSAAAADGTEPTGRGDASLTTRHNAAWILERMGRLEEARGQILDLIPDVLRLAYPELLLGVAENYATVLAELGENRDAAELLGSVDAMRERLGAPRHRRQAAEHEGRVALARSAISPTEWDRAYLAGKSHTVENMLTRLRQR